MENKFSIIIPVFNQKENTKNLLDKLIYQKNTYYPETEIIVINDGSTEDMSFLKDYKEIILVEQENKGVSAARNIGLKTATGSYIAFIDNDDDITKDYLHVNYVTMRKGYDYCIFRWFADNTVTEGNIPEDSLLWNRAVWGYSFNSECIKNIYFNENLNVAEDVEWLTRIINNNLKRGVVDRAIYYYNTLNEKSLSHKFNNGEIEKEKSSTPSETIELPKIKNSNSKSKNKKRKKR